MPAEIMGLGIGLHAGEVVLDYRILRPFLVQWNRAWKARGKWTEQESSKLAASVRDELSDILGPSSPSVVGGGPKSDTIPPSSVMLPSSLGDMTLDRASTMHGSMMYLVK